jgi:macrolide transport system ATP-binding/permease protein
VSIYSRLRSWTLSRRRSCHQDESLDRELAAWVDELTERFETAGVPHAEARRRALIETGGVQQVKEAVRDVRVGAWLTMTLMQDIRHAWRMWRAYPLVTAAALLSLALGMGANTAVVSVINALLLRSAPVADPRTLVSLYSTSSANPGWHQTSYRNFEDLAAALPVPVAAYAPVPVGLADDGHLPEQVSTELVSGNYFAVLGVHAAIGRVFAFTPAEDRAPDRYPEAVISDALWQRRFGGDAGVVNKSVQLNGRPFTIVGIAPPGFTGIDVIRAVDVWLPASNVAVLTGVTGFYFHNRAIGMFDVFARTTPETKQAELTRMLRATATRLAQTFPREDTGIGFVVRPFREGRLAPSAREAWIIAAELLAVVVGVVLLVACANVANLLLARGVARQREIALRLAIGASRRHLVQQLLVESVLMSTAGAIIGLGVAWGALSVLSTVRPEFIPPTFDVPIDRTTLVVTGIIAFVTVPVFGLFPALRLSRRDLITGLKYSGMPLSHRAPRNGSTAILFAQAALATIAMILAGLFVRSLRSAQTIDPGFDTDRVAIVSFDLGMLRYDNAKGPAFVRRVNDRLRTVDGVVASAVASHVLLDGTGLASRITVAGHDDAEALSIEAGAVGLDYFRTMNIPIVAGRAFRESDAAQVSEFGWAVVNRTMAERLWPGREAVGQRFHVLGIKEPYVVVGVAADAHYDTLGELHRPYFYIYYDQTPGLKKLTLHVRTAGPPRPLLGTIAREIRAVDPNLPLIAVRTMSDVVSQAMWVPRTGAAVFMFFGIVAVILAATGIYGVSAFFVHQHRRDTGIRLALGAPGRRIVLPVIRRTVMPTLWGVAVGLMASYAGARTVERLLIGVGPRDVLSFAGAAVVLSIVSVAAATLPAFSALRADPLDVLRTE